jgi:hypothetical protein
MNAYHIGATVPAADVPLWFEVLQKHEWFAEYVEHGIQHFAAAWSEQRPNLRNMVVVNAEGLHKPFTYHKYLTRGALPKMAKVMAALRTEIAEQIAPLSRRGFHVHHSGKPFVQIVDEFLIANAHRWHVMETEAAGATGYRLRDRTIALHWAAFHRVHATLEVLTQEENRALGASGYRMLFKEPALPPLPY